MPDIKNPPGESLSEQQLDDLDVERQRERLERSRPGNLQSDRQQGSQQSAEAPPRQDKR